MICTLALALAAQPSFLFVDNLLIGEWTGQKWVNQGMAQPPDYDTPNMPEKPAFGFPLTTVRTGSREMIDEMEYAEEVGGIFLGPWEDAMRYSDVLWTGARPGYPRAISAQSPDQEVYRRLVRAEMNAIGKGPFKPLITGLFRVDLDGDGSQEVVIEAQVEHGEEGFPWFSQEDGFMSAVMVRDSAGKVHPVYYSASGDEEFDLRLNNRLRAIADLNRDGVYEIVASSDYYEGQAAGVFEFRNGKLTKLVEMGAGV